MAGSSAKLPEASFEAIRALIPNVLHDVKSYELPRVCMHLGIQASVAPDDEAEAHSSKRSYVLARIADLSADGLVELAGKVLCEYPSEDLREALVELTEHSRHRVSKLVRCDVLKVLNRFDSLFGDSSVMECLEEVFGIAALQERDSLRLGNSSVRAQIEQHYIRHPDLSNEEMLIQCGALTCTQFRFFALLEKIVHPMTRRDAEQATLAGAISDALKRDGFVLKQAAVESGYPIYRVIRAEAGVAGAMKNLIFASTGEKPELVIRDALNNDVEITKHADKVLVYDRPLPSSGMLLWNDLRDWYAETQAVDPAEGSKMLYGRLRQSVIGANSPGEYAIFRGYYDRFAKLLGDRLPALVPQVYLHYDPYTLRERGDEKFLARQRMDFLLMLEHGVRIVIEIDGRHHYGVLDRRSPQNYIANAKLYAEMAIEDRRLRLMGYEVYRFGGYEFRDVNLSEKPHVGPEAEQRVAEFFDRLFARHGVRQALFPR
ncbi:MULTISPECIES: hypothetical protein [unclassified Achromobacter]|uniref:AbiJ-related protein n=1 Tax=unclassified Achromobacter TaxID=2626865 RepID=UPI000B51A551|nr:MULTISPECIES: hypothetical protein [unclassified Achromobacter]OWT72951.1 hypothetical protein CEY05_24030 [Achromobacter sp. HZ34]OWT74169.1 hypothetical protein CEY04_22865 [Achromobacter sp. HZ28]